MKFVIHRPFITADEYDLPLYPDAPDDAVIAASAGALPAKTEVIETGAAFVYMRGTDDVDEAGRRLAEARAAMVRAMEEARVAAVAEIDAGLISERAAADKLGVDRNTVRGWRGKGRAAG